MSAAAWVAMVAILAVAVLLWLMARAVVAASDDDVAAAPLVAPVRPRGRLEALPPVRAVVLAWGAPPPADDAAGQAAWRAARGHVAQVMPDLAASLDRMVVDARRYAQAGETVPAVGPCAYGAHDWRVESATESSWTLARCDRCGALKSPGASS